MNSFQIIETIGVLMLIGIQSYIFWKTYQKIQVFKEIFPESHAFHIRKPLLRKDKFELHPHELLSNLDLHIKDSEPVLIQPALLNEDGIVISKAKFEADTRLVVDLIDKKEGGNEVTTKILSSLNTYLIRNKGVASDFHLIKDVVERNCDVVEQEIHQTISLPLYIGLLGTFFGIVIGLFQVSGVDFTAQTTGDSSAIDEAISLLLGGVKIAMIASFTGLLLTIINTGYFFKGAKSIVENYKNDFYTFIQIDLLPLLNQNINSTLYSLQNNLHKFNEEFKENITGLSSVMGKNHDALIAQEKLFTKLENIDIAAFATANVKVLRELNLSTDKFGQFNQYLSQMSEMVANSQVYTEKINEMISRTDNFNALGNRLIESFGDNKMLLEFLQQHYNSLDESSQMIISSVGRVNNTLDESLDNLKSFTQDKIIEVQKLVNKEMGMLETQYPEKWKKLDNLSLLETLSNNLDIIKGNSKYLSEQLVKVNSNLAIMAETKKNNNIFKKLDDRFSRWIKDKK